MTLVFLIPALLAICAVGYLFLRLMACWHSCRELFHSPAHAFSIGCIVLGLVGTVSLAFTGSLSVRGLAVLSVGAIPLAAWMLWRDWETGAFPKCDQLPAGPVAAFFSSATVLCLVILFSTAMLFPLTSWDGRFIWNYKAMVLFHEGTVFSDSYQDPGRVHFHRDYPLLLPIVESVLYVIRGGVDERLARSFLVALFGLFLLGMQRALRAESGPQIAAFVVFLFALTAFRTDFADRDGVTLTSGVADIPLSFLAFLSAVGLWKFLSRGGTSSVVMAGIFAGGCLLLKLEGVVFLACSAAALLAACFFRKRSISAMKPAFVYVGVAVIVGAPYFLLRTRLPNFYDEDFSRTLTFEFIPNAIARLPVVLHGILGEMAGVSRWNVVWLAWPAAVVVTLAGRRRRLALFFDLLAGLWLLSYIVAYCFSPLHLGYHLQTSASRLLSHFLPLVYFRIGLLAGDVFSMRSVEKEIADAVSAGDSERIS